jgi:hypothetical protein
MTTSEALSSETQPRRPAATMRVVAAVAGNALEL